MVLKQRTSVSQRLPSANSPRICTRLSSARSPLGVSLPMGDGNNSSRRSRSFFSSGGSRQRERTSPSMSLGGQQPLSPGFFGSPRNKSGHGGNGLSSYSSSGDHPKNSENGLDKRSTTAILSGALILVVGYFIYSTSAQLREREAQLFQIKSDFHVMNHKVRETDIALDDAHSNNHKLEIKSRKLEKDNSKLQKELESAKQGMELGDVLLEGKTMSGLAQDEINSLLIRRQSAMKSRIGLLQTQIQDISRREAVDRFGPGPHHVIFTVKMQGETSTFTVQLASLDHMPHSVHLFLQMVNHQLWDDTIFLHTAQHVLQAAPLAYPGTSKRDQFSKAGLTHLAFQEYSEEYAHEKYTLGFGGRPAGPDFYISTQNNSDHHGPGGQEHHDLHEEADPCFGIVVDGKDVVDKLHAKSIAMADFGKEDENWDDENIPITTIVSARIV